MRQAAVRVKSAQRGSRRHALETDAERYGGERRRTDGARRASVDETCRRRAAREAGLRRSSAGADVCLRIATTHRTQREAETRAPRGGGHRPAAAHDRRSPANASVIGDLHAERIGTHHESRVWAREDVEAARTMVVLGRARECKRWRPRGAHSLRRCRTRRAARPQASAASSGARWRRVELDLRLLPAVGADARGVHAQQPQELHEGDARHVEAF